MLGIDKLNWSELVGSTHLSVVTQQATNPHDTDVSTSDTIALMDQYAYADSSHPLIQQAASEIKLSAYSNDARDLIHSTFDYVQSHVKFVEDESITNKLFGIDSDVELLIHPARLLSMRTPIGDCDDFSMLTKSLLLALDIDSSFITVAADQSNPMKWSHVYLIAQDEDGNHIPIDASHGKYVGWEAQNVTREKIWNSKNSSVGRINKDMPVMNTQRPTSFKIPTLPSQAVEHGLFKGWGKHRNEMIGLHGLGNLGAEYDYGGEYGGPGDYISSVPSNSSTDWGSILAPLTRVGSQIAIAQFGQPQLAPDTFIRKADGSILTNQPLGYGAGMFGGGNGGSMFGGSGLLIGVVVIGGLLFLMKR